MADESGIASQIIRTLTSGILVIRHDGSIVTSNPAAAAHLLVKEEAIEAGAQLRGESWAKPFLDILDEVCDSDITAQRRRVIVEDNLKRSKEIGVTATPVEVSEGERGAIFLFVDMTERRQLERAAELNRQLATLGELTAGVVHELRSPVMVISGMAELIGRTLQDDASVQDKVKLITQECKNLENLVSQFLSFSKPFDIHAEWISPEEIARRAAKLVRIRAEERKIKISEQIDADLPQMLGDAGKLVQVLVNLLNNAIDAVADETGTVSLAAHASDDEIVFTVSDNGPGFEGTDEELFQPFVTHKEGGTGLGLSIVSRIVHAHRGGISAHNRPEGGATFAVSLPIGNTD